MGNGNLLPLKAKYQSDTSTRGAGIARGSYSCGCIPADCRASALKGGLRSHGSACEPATASRLKVSSPASGQSGQTRSVPAGHGESLQRGSSQESTHFRVTETEHAFDHRRCDVETAGFKYRVCDSQPGTYVMTSFSRSFPQTIMGGQVAITRAKAFQALLQHSEMPGLIIRNTQPVADECLAVIRTEPPGDIHRQVDRIQFNMCNGMQQGDPVRRPATLRRRGISCASSSGRSDEPEGQASDPGRSPEISRLASLSKAAVPKALSLPDCRFPVSVAPPP